MTREQVRTTLCDALSQVETASTFAVGGVAHLPLPGLHVANVGPIALPLQPGQADALIGASEQAPFGKGANTVVDLAVRNCRQIDGAHVHLSAAWNAAVSTLADEATEMLGVEADVEERLYKLVLYPPGGFFKRHKDTEKEEGMFGTMVIQLPARFEGGALKVGHGGEVKMFDWAAESESLFHYAAFYGDCEHELRHVTSGYRLCLLYNLVRVGGPVPSIKEQDEMLEGVKSAVQMWENVDKFVMMLEHEYTEKNLMFSRLKGRDAAIVAMLQRTKLLDLHLALVEKHEHGTAEMNYYERRHRYGDWSDEEEGRHHVMEDVLDTDVSVKKWVAEDDQVTHLKGLHIHDSDTLDNEELFEEGADPDREEYEGYTGNAGAMVDYWYHRAVLVMWPRRHSVAMTCKADFGAAVQLAMRRAQEDAADAVETLLWIIQYANKFPHKSQALVAELLEVAITFKHSGAIRAVIGFMARHVEVRTYSWSSPVVVGSGCVSEKHASLLAKAVQLEGWDGLQDVVLAAVQATSASAVGSCCTLALALRNHSATVAGESVASVAFDVMLESKLQDAAASACAHMLFVMESCAQRKREFISRVGELSAAALANVIQTVQKSSSDLSAVNGFPEAFAQLVRKYIRKALSAKAAETSVPHAALVWSILLGRQSQNEALLELFCTAAINANCGPLLKVLLASSKSHRRDANVTRIASARVVQLSYARPVFSNCQPEAYVPRHPGVTQFLRGDAVRLEYSGFDGIGHARNFARKHFQGGYNSVEKHSARAEAGGRGAGAYVVITKTNAAYERLRKQYEVDQGELVKVSNTFLRVGEVSEEAVDLTADD